MLIPPHVHISQTVPRVFSGSLTGGGGGMGGMRNVTPGTMPLSMGGGGGTMGGGMTSNMMSLGGSPGGMMQQQHTQRGNFSMEPDCIVLRNVRRHLLFTVASLILSQKFHHNCATF